MPRTTDRTVISLQWALVGVLGEFVRLKSNEWRVWCDGGGGTGRVLYAVRALSSLVNMHTLEIFKHFCKANMLSSTGLLSRVANAVPQVR